MRLLTSLLVTAMLAVPPAAAGAASARSADCSGASASDFDGDGTDDAVVGDPFADHRGIAGAGAVHVLLGRGEGATVVSAPEPGAGDGFGWSVKLTHLDADRCADLLIGAPYADVSGLRDAGAVYAVYGGAGREAVRLVAPRPEREAHFGWSLASGGTLVAVGAPYEDADGVADAGAVHLFQTGALGQGRRISQDSEGVSGNSEAGDMFGWSVAIGRLGGVSGEQDLAVGAPYENDDGLGRQDGGGRSDSGSIAVLFDVRTAQSGYAGRKWDLHEIVDADAGDRFGYAMAYAEEGDVGYLAVSAPLGDGGRVKDSGLVHLFQASSTAEITPAGVFDQGAEGAAGEGYGFSLAFTGEGGARLAVGVPFDGPDQRGGVRLVPVRDPGQTRLVGRGGPGDRSGWSVGFSGNRLVVGAPDRNGSGAVALLGRNDSTGIPLAPGTGKVPALDGGGPADFGAAVG
ncbi:FG-GAP-like repeat-containing protein [Streptosporangium roseum]|uniref:Integrin alpha beta-propellor repeat protein n=1 Tax=Streptosporangium roseum (strain ATCC 12428 / DSM 43021 / JCM 3005 / KCTC 9067 / NCIMB 10171 / NRRL 2505 / NI 9100) TaxID=479432 RepID=D2B428_STRRD|nr:FG-GAP-like repeat-containing protein [Streptosporangium roseum]ACZ91262.1 hypothetical protein Sros_8620 [Streptosporangium roseum DSM 43021]